LFVKRGGGGRICFSFWGKKEESGEKIRKGGFRRLSLVWTARKRGGGMSSAWRRGDKLKHTSRGEGRRA